MTAKFMLMGASRQYRHNNSDEFVFGYDEEEVLKLVNELIGYICVLEQQNKCLKIENELHSVKG